jgi:pyruvate-formate lyase-activating enzyme
MHYANRSSRTNASASSRFYKELECRVVYISDGEVSEEDAPLMAKFLSCKQAHNDIRAIRLVRTETIVEVKPKKSTKALQEPLKKHSALSCDNARLFKAVADCIAKCINLESIIIVGVELPRAVFDPFGRALIRCKSGA